MSQEGLLRTFLYHDVSNMPALARSLFPNRLDMFVLFGQSLAWRPSWSWRELVAAFRLFVKKATEDVNLALFIDGLDEYKSDHAALIDFIQSFIGPGVKICVLSRPWVIFKDAFKTRPSLRLEIFPTAI
jgi:hypothetical protein